MISWDGGPRYWIVEAKRDHNDRGKALKEAQEYADRINKLKPNVARFATGIAGTPDQSFYVTTTYWDGDEWQEVAINNYEATGFLSLAQCQDVLNRNSPRILHYDVDLGHFLQKANAINATLYRNGVAARNRARFVAGLLLALAQDSNMRIDDRPITLVNDVNGRIRELLATHGKEDFLPEVELKLPNTSENHNKYRTAIVQTMQHLREMNIRSAINSGTDALGQFYETFLKYANDASEMGIVLTPRHITKFAVDVMGIQPGDLVFDPTCGTGGFLVAALDSIRASHYDSHPDVYNTFRNDCLFGIEQADDVFGLALVNMIFRGDGKSRIHNGDCFDNHFSLQAGNVLRLNTEKVLGGPISRPFTRVLMNPPFATNDPESKFVDHALEQMQPSGLLFAILPNGPITGAGVKEKIWRHEVLKRHTIRAVVKMPNDLFTPTAQKGTYALILEAWRPHEKDDLVFFGFLHDDLSASRKSKTLGGGRARDNLKQITRDLARFLRDGRSRILSMPEEIFVSALNMDSDCDFASEAYLESPVANTARVVQPVEGLFTELARRMSRNSPSTSESLSNTRDFLIEDMFGVSRGDCPPMKNLEYGNVPVVTSSEQSNGISGYYDVPPELVKSNCITISANGGGGAAFWHPYRFAAVSDALVCVWQKGWRTTPAFCLYVCSAISQNAWRFDYYRKSTQSRVLADVRVRLPMKDNKVDYRFIDREMHQMPGFVQLVEMLDGPIKNDPTSYE